MRSESPTKSPDSRSIFSKNIRLNLNSRFIPEDFFPESISQISRNRKRSLHENPSQLIRKKSANDPTLQQTIESEKQARNFQLLKKRLIKIKQSCPPQLDSEPKKKISFKRKSTSREGLRKILQKQKSKQKITNPEKAKTKGHSKKLMDYMQKMKNVINIDIKFQEDLMCPIFQKNSKQTAKQNPEQVETDDSLKLQRRRPKSEINSRQRLQSKQKVKLEAGRIMAKPLKIKIKQVSRMIKESIEQKIKTKNQRYNKFVQIPLDQDGMLTFYGSPDSKWKGSYDSRKYSARTSLPRLQK